VNRNDSISWGRILRLLKNIGQKKSQSIIDWMKREHPMPWQIDEWPGAGKSDDALKPLSVLIKKLSVKDINPEKAVELVSIYYDPILKENFDNFPKRQKDLDQMILMASRYKKLRAFLDDLILEPPTSSADIDSGLRKDCLTLSTVHSAKGLEWSVVFIIWVMEGYFPSAKAGSSMEAIEEERRLMYVAATRARDQLILCYPGQEEVPVWQLADIDYRNGLSLFIRALPQEVITHISQNYPEEKITTQWPARKKRIHQIDTSATLFSQMKEKGLGAGDPSGLRPGDRVRHPAFGRGVISKFKDNAKVEVLFRDVGRKLLHLEHTILEKV
jgi:DNA helicase-2/ATP-dependent DNA helicase PcrA